jgi:hypothetical protein
VVTCDATGLSGERLVSDVRATISGPSREIELAGEVSVGGDVAAGTAQ